MAQFNRSHICLLEVHSNGVSCLTLLPQFVYCTSETPSWATGHSELPCTTLPAHSTEILPSVYEAGAMSTVTKNELEQSYCSNTTAETVACIWHLIVVTSYLYILYFWDIDHENVCRAYNDFQTSLKVISIVTIHNSLHNSHYWPQFLWYTRTLHHSPRQKTSLYSSFISSKWIQCQISG